MPSPPAGQRARFEKSLKARSAPKYVLSANRRRSFSVRHPSAAKKHRSAEDRFDKQPDMLKQKIGFYSDVFRNIDYNTTSKTRRNLDTQILKSVFKRVISNMDMLPPGIPTGTSKEEEASLKKFIEKLQLFYVILKYYLGDNWIVQILLEVLETEGPKANERFYNEYLSGSVLEAVHSKNKRSLDTLFQKMEQGGGGAQRGGGFWRMGAMAGIGLFSLGVYYANDLQFAPFGKFDIQERLSNYFFTPAPTHSVGQTMPFAYGKRGVLVPIAEGGAMKLAAENAAVARRVAAAHAQVQALEMYASVSTGVSAILKKTKVEFEAPGVSSANVALVAQSCPRQLGAFGDKAAENQREELTSTQHSLDIQKAKLKALQASEDAVTKAWTPGFGLVYGLTKAQKAELDELPGKINSTETTLNMLKAVTPSTAGECKKADYLFGAGGKLIGEMMDLAIGDATLHGYLSPEYAGPQHAATVVHMVQNAAPTLRKAVDKQLEAALEGKNTAERNLKEAILRFNQQELVYKPLLVRRGTLEADYAIAREEHGAVVVQHQELTHKVQDLQKLVTDTKVKGYFTTSSPHNASLKSAEEQLSIKTKEMDGKKKKVEGSEKLLKGIEQEISRIKPDYLREKQAVDFLEKSLKMANETLAEAEKRKEKASAELSSFETAAQKIKPPVKSAMPATNARGVQPRFQSPVAAAAAAAADVAAVFANKSSYNVGKAPQGNNMQIVVGANGSVSLPGASKEYYSSRDGAVMEYPRSRKRFLSHAKELRNAAANIQGSNTGIPKISENMRITDITGQHTLGMSLGMPVGLPYVGGPIDFFWSRMFIENGNAVLSSVKAKANDKSWEKANKAIPTALTLALADKSWEKANKAIPIALTLAEIEGIVDGELFAGGKMPTTPLSNVMKLFRESLVVAVVEDSAKFATHFYDVANAEYLKVIAEEGRKGREELIEDVYAVYARMYPRDLLEKDTNGKILEPNAVSETKVAAVKNQISDEINKMIVLVQRIPSVERGYAAVSDVVHNTLHRGTDEPALRKVSPEEFVRIPTFVFKPGDWSGFTAMFIHDNFIMIFAIIAFSIGAEIFLNFFELLSAPLESLVGFIKGKIDGWTAVNKARQEAQIRALQPPPPAAAPPPPAAIANHAEQAGHAADLAVVAAQRGNAPAVAVRAAAAAEAHAVAAIEGVNAIAAEGGGGGGGGGEVPVHAQANAAVAALAALQANGAVAVGGQANAPVAAAPAQANEAVAALAALQANGAQGGQGGGSRKIKRRRGKNTRRR